MHGDTGHSETIGFQFHSEVSLRFEGDLWGSKSVREHMDLDDDKDHLERAIDQRQNKRWFTCKKRESAFITKFSVADSRRHFDHDIRTRIMICKNQTAYHRHALSSSKGNNTLISQNG
jgi:hypothetical protein